MQNKLKIFVREILMLLGIFSLCFFQCYFAMMKFKDSVSAYSMEDSYNESIFWTTLDVVVMFVILKLLLFKLKFKKIIYSIFFVFGCFVTNLGIFQSRESAWSTYLLSEEIYYTFDLSIIWICIATLFYLIYVKVIYYLFDK
ncbi:MAG: hypothetical protein ACK5N8_09110 [Alphaproteobacteria bacterium]